MKTPAEFAAAKRRGEKIAFVTCYDAPTARLVADTGVDAVLVGVGSRPRGIDDQLLPRRSATGV